MTDKQKICKKCGENENNICQFHSKDIHKLNYKADCNVWWDIDNKKPGKVTASKNIDLENKPKPSLLPLDLYIKYHEPALREGLIKYDREDWRLGFKITDMFDAMMRHICKFYYDGEDFDKDIHPEAEKIGIKKHHIGAAMFCLSCMADTIENHPELDDRFSKIF